MFQMFQDGSHCQSLSQPTSSALQYPYVLQNKWDRTSTNVWLVDNDVSLFCQSSVVALRDFGSTPETCEGHGRSAGSNELRVTWVFISLSKRKYVAHLSALELLFFFVYIYKKRIHVTLSKLTDFHAKKDGQNSKKLAEQPAFEP